MNPAVVTRYREALAHTSGPPSLIAARHTALERFITQGLPTTRDEDWKYTSLDFLEQAEWHAPEAVAMAPSTGVAAESERDLEYASAPALRGAAPSDAAAGWFWLKFSDGRLTESYPPARYAHSLLAHAASAPVARHLGTLANDAALSQINNALWQDGLWLQVPPDETCPPLFALHSASEADAMLHMRNLIVLEAGATAVLVEHYRGTSGIAYWRNLVTEIVLGEGAQLIHVKLTEESAAATHTAQALVKQARDSRYHALSISLGGRVTRHDVSVSLEEAGAECQLDGLFIADLRRHIDQHLHVEHAAPHTTSRQTWRGIASGRGRGILDARVVVQAGAQKADAMQSSNNLLLSPYAEIDVKPQLEIYADDVKCGHGATVGQLDEAQVFYLRSRGIAVDAARALLLRGFAEEALTLLKHAGPADWLEPHLAAAMPVASRERSA
jgi:Fe-S cluster assembly protein SufD